MYTKVGLEKQQPQWMPAKEQRKVKLSSAVVKVFHSSLCLMGQETAEKESGGGGE